MKKVGLVFLMLVLTTMPLVVAYDTEITVTTNPNHFVMIRVFESGDRLNLIQSVFDRRVDFNSQYKLVHTSNVSSLDIEVYIKDQPNGDTKHYQRFDGVTAGQPFAATVPEGAAAALSDTTAAPLEKTLNDTNSTEPTNVTNTTLTAPSTITGNVIQGSWLKKTQGYYILAGAILAMAVLGGGVIVSRRKSKQGHAVAPKSPPGSDKADGELQQKLQETQARLDQATKELSQMKNADQIKQLQKSIDAEQEQIRKLQQGLS